MIEIEQAFFGIIVPEDAASLVIRVGDDWEMSGSGLIFGNLFGIVFLFICLGGAVLTLWTVYRVFLKLFFIWLLHHLHFPLLQAHMKLDIPDQAGSVHFFVHCLK